MIHRTPALLAALFVASAGCGGASSATDAGPRDDSGESIDAPSADLDAGPAEPDAGASDIDAGSAADLCAFVDTIDRSCTADTDCTVRVHQTDCCGNMTAIGLNVSQTDAFAAGEAPCQAAYPLCDCPAGPITTDSGETALDPDSVQAACVSRGPRNVCLTYVTMRPPNGR